MIIKEISLKNFKSHRSTRVSFEKGINLISGRNGAGKSSILEAILIALYGLRQGFGRKSDLIHIGAGEYSIELIFEMNGREYRIRRNSGGNSELKGDIMIEGDQKINEWVEKNVSQFHIFTGAVYIRQGEIETIISDESGREKIIRKITKIEDYENAWKNLGAVIKELENEMKSHMEILRQKDECERRLNEKTLEIERVEREIWDSKNRLEKLKELIKKVSSEKRILDELKEQIDRNNLEKITIEGEIEGLKGRLGLLEKNKAEVEQKISSLLENLKKLEVLEREARRYSELSEFYRTFLKAVNEIESKLKNLELERDRILIEVKKCEEEKENLEKIRKEIAELEKKINALAVEVEKWQKIRMKFERKTQIEKILSEKNMSPEKVEKAFSTIQKARESSKAIIEEFEKISRQKGFLISEEKRISEIIEKLRFIAGICPVCGRELTEEHRKKLLDKFSSEIASIREKMIKIGEIEKKMREEKKKIDDILEKQDLVLKFKQLVDELEKINEELKNFDVEKLKTQNDEFEKLKNRIEFLKENEMKSLEIVQKLDLFLEKLEKVKIREFEAQKERELLFNKLKEMGFSSIEELETEIGKLKASYEEWLGIKKTKEELKSAELKLKDLENEIKKTLDDLRLKIDQFEKKKKILSDLEGRYDKKRHSDLENNEKELSREIAGHEERVSVIEKTLESLKVDKEYLERQLGLIKESERKAKVIEKAIPELTKIREKFASYKNIVAEFALKEVEKYASEIFEEFTEGKYSGIKLKRISEYGKERLRIFVIYHGKEYETSFLSGGELVALGIAFRLALSMFEAGGRIPLLIMDEPTPFLDEERRRKLVDITLNYLRRIPQVIIVSHDEELKDATDKVILVENRGGVSFVASQ